MLAVKFYRNLVVTTVTITPPTPDAEANMWKVIIKKKKKKHLSLAFCPLIVFVF